MIDDHDDFDIDDGGFDEFGEMDGGQERVSFRDTWDSNPLLKIAAVVLGVSLLVGGYLTLFDKKDPSQNKSVVLSNDQSNVKTTPGGEEVDAAYREAVEQQNQQSAERALQTGGSVLPTPIASEKASGIEIPDAPMRQEIDPLEEWRTRAEGSRALQQDVETLQDDDLPLQPDLVPMVQPIRPQQVVKMDPEAAKALGNQMRVIVGAQAPLQSQKTIITSKESYYIKQQEENRSARAKQVAMMQQGGGTANDASSGVSKKAETRVILPAGNISYIQLLTELNSDIPGPALAQILSGPFAGGRALGEFSVEGEYLVITFRRIIKDNVSYATNGIALNEATTLAGHQTDIDHHYFTRVILPAAAKFVEGYASAVAETGTTTTTTAGGGVAQNEPEPDATEELYSGLEEAGSKISEVLDEGSSRPITVIVAKGTTMGLLFMDPVTTNNAE